MGCGVLGADRGGWELPSPATFSILTRIDGFGTPGAAGGFGFPDSFSILTRIDGFGTESFFSPSVGHPNFQHPNSDRWFWNANLGYVGIQYAGFQHPNSDRWVWNPRCAAAAARHVSSFS